MTFSLSKPDFTKYFTSETKYSIAITADDSVTKKFPVLEDGPLKVALFWRTQFDELAQFKNFDAANKFTNVLLLLSGDAKDKWINARNDIMPNNENPTKARFRAVWTAFIINYGASDKTAKSLRDFLRKAKKPADMKLYDFKTRLYQLNKYLPLLPGPHGRRLDDADMFDTIQECVPDWNNSYIASNTMTENINDLLEYYGKLELQEAKRKPKTRRQDNTKSQQQPARNQNQRHQGNQNQRNGNNCCNEESFCSYHQLRGHSDAECCDPRNPKGVNANNARHNDRNNNRNRNRNHQQDRNYRNNQDSRNNQQRNHRYPTCSQQQREESHQQQEASDDHSQHTTNNSESDNEIFALEEKRNINANDQNIITKQDYVPEIAIGVLADVVTK
jgi:hypothetical protein